MTLVADRQSRLLSDILALTALPATWVGAAPERIAAALADALDRALPAAATAVLLQSEDGAALARRGEDPRVASAIEAAGLGAAVPDVPGLLVRGVGPSGARGAIAVASDEPSFPTDADRILVVLAANQGDTALREIAASRQVASIQRELARLEKLSALGQLVSGVAHEIRTPLTYASTSLHVARSRVGAWARASGPPPKDLVESLDSAQAALDRINAHLLDLRRFSTPAAARSERMGLSVVVEQALRIFRATHVGQVVVTSSLQAEGSIRADAAAIQQVVLNLLQNASEASPGGGSVRMATHDEGESVVLAVEDDGPGIPPDLHGRLFDPFFTTKQGGTGLGLSIVRRTVEAHRGSIRLHSAPGEGATFTIAFPRA